MPDWTALYPHLVDAFADEVVPIHLRGIADVAQTQWRRRMEVYGLDPRDEGDLFAFVAGLVTMSDWMSDAVIDGGVFDPLPRASLHQLQHDALSTVLGLLGPYLEAHLEPGVLGSKHRRETEE